MFAFAEDSYGSLEMDYAEHDRMLAERHEWLQDQLPWLTAAELRQQLDESKAFPGWLADYTALSVFVEKLKKTASRIIPCKMQLGSVSIPVDLDVARNRLHIRSGGYDSCGLRGLVSFTVGTKSPVLTAHLDSGVVSLMSSYDVGRVLAYLEKQKQLPSIRLK
jgi:hypothetical protein